MIPGDNTKGIDTIDSLHSKTNLNNELESKCPDDNLTGNSLEIESKIIPISDSEDNQTVCRLLKLHFRNFFNDIYIPFNFFRDAQWNISKVLYNNEDILFYNKKYVSTVDEERFFQVYDKYISMLEEIMSMNNLLLQSLNYLTDNSTSRWKKIKKNSSMESLLNEDRYTDISPLYIVNQYVQTRKNIEENGNSQSDLDVQMKSKLDKIVLDSNKEIEKFEFDYESILYSFVYENPYYSTNCNLEYKIYVKAFINTVIMTIIELADKLIDINVYTIHAIVNDIIDVYTPLDSINQYKSSENERRRLVIV